MITVLVVFIVIAAAVIVLMSRVHRGEPGQVTFWFRKPGPGPGPGPGNVRPSRRDNKQYPFRRPLCSRGYGLPRSCSSPTWL